MPKVALLIMPFLTGILELCLMFTWPLPALGAEKQTVQQPAWFSPAPQNRKKGLSADKIRENAVLGRAAAPAKNAGKEKCQQVHSPMPGEIHFAYEKQHSTWSPKPPASQQKSPDESLALQGEHHVGAYSTLDNSKDLDIQVGPELILKDEKHNSPLTRSDQPDSELGVGMRFSYDF